jgi:hypothetical protein
VGVHTKEILVNTSVLGDGHLDWREHIGAQYEKKYSSATKVRRSIGAKKRPTLMFSLQHCNTSPYHGVTEIACILTNYANYKNKLHKGYH